MPLDTAELFDDAGHCFKVLESIRDYSKYCKEYKLTPAIDNVFQSAVTYCDLFITRISKMNKILDREEWKDDLEFFWQRGYRKRKRFIRLFYFVLYEIQQKIDEIGQEISDDTDNNLYQHRIGFSNN